MQQFRKGDVVHVRVRVAADSDPTYTRVNSVTADSKHAAVLVVTNDSIVHVEPRALQVGEMVSWRLYEGAETLTGKILALVDEGVDADAVIERFLRDRWTRPIRQLVPVKDLVRVELAPRKPCSPGCGGLCDECGPAPNAAAPALVMRAECCGARMTVQKCWNCPL